MILVFLFIVVFTTGVVRGFHCMCCAVFTALFDAVFTALFDAVFTALFDAVFTVQCYAVFTALIARGIRLPLVFPASFAGHPQSSLHVCVVFTALDCMLRFSPLSPLNVTAQGSSLSETYLMDTYLKGLDCSRTYHS